MASPIKPPGGKPPVDPTADVGASDAKPRSTEKAEAFREAMGAEEASGSSGAEAASATADIVADLQAGRIDAQTAVDRLVARALESPMAQLLDDAGRAQLEEHIRTTLEDDPNLAALMKDMGA